MLVMGIDGSTKSTGVSIMKDGELIYYTLISIKDADAFVRIKKMLIEIYKILDKYEIDIICMEKAFTKTNIDTTMKLANLAGGVMAYCALHNIEFQHPVPSEWRKKIGIQMGRVKRDALKEMAISAVKKEYGIDVNDDVSEAILLARSIFNLPKLEITEDDLWGE